MKVAIIGAGAWGTALAWVCARGGANVVLWSYDAMTADYGQMPQNITVVSDMACLGDADLWLAVTPAQFFGDTMRAAAQYYNGCPIIICTKGADPKTGMFMSDVLHDAIPACMHIGVLSGPQFAAEAANGIPTGSTVGGDPVVADAARKALGELYLTFTDDIFGVQLCGVGKNAVALICGYNAHRGENARALDFTRAWNDVVNIGIACGAKMATFMDLCGIGDLYLTATSTTSRNYQAGIDIAANKPISGTVEGISALAGLVARAAAHGVDVPTLSKYAQIIVKDC